MSNILYLLFFASAAAGALMLIADTLTRERSRIVAALRMVAVPADLPPRRIMRVRVTPALRRANLAPVLLRAAA